MGISIKNAEVEEAIRRLAAERKVDLTEAVGLAVRNELERGHRTAAARLAAMRSVADRMAVLPLRDSRTDEAIIGYDERGLPK